MDRTATRPDASRDQRRHTRARVRFTARYSSATLNLDGHVTDVSPDGLFFCSDYLDGQGETARLWITVPSRAKPLELRGEVRWVNDTPHAGGMGLRLIEPSVEDRALLTALASGAEVRAPSGNA